MHRRCTDRLRRLTSPKHEMVRKYLKWRKGVPLLVSVEYILDDGAMDGHGDMILFEDSKLYVVVCRCLKSYDDATQKRMLDHAKERALVHTCRLKSWLQHLQHMTKDNVATTMPIMGAILTDDNRDLQILA